MIRRTKQDWLLLFEQHQQSGLSASAFCRNNNLCPKYFSKRKSDLSKSAKREKSSRFIRAKLQPQDSLRVFITLQHQQTKLNLPTTISPNWLADFVKALA